MQKMFRGLFCDGMSPIEETVEAVHGEGLWIIRRSNGETIHWLLTDLNCEKQAESVLYTERQTDATLLIPTSEQDYLSLPGLERMSQVQGLRKKTLVAVLLLAVVMLVTLVILGMRPLSITIADHISPERERELFGSLLPETFLEKHGCHDSEATEILTQLGQSLSAEERRVAPIDFMLLDWDMANAFALPGRKIAVTTGLLRKIHSSEQLAAILSHELGHIELRHNLSELIRASLAAFAWGVLVGDFSGAFVVDPQLMKQAGEMALSREAEEEADRYGAERMLAVGFSPQALASGLDVITGPETETMNEHELLRIIKPILDVFSSHPETAKRIAYLRKTYPQEEGQEPLSMRSWNILRSACPLVSDSNDAEASN